MPKITWNNFYELLTTRQFKGGDIIFISHPRRVGMIHQHAIKFAQHFRSGHFGQTSQYEDDPHICHACVIVEKQTPHGPQLIVCESTPPRTREVTFDKFLDFHKDREFYVFRPYSQDFADIINSLCLSYTSLKIRYSTIGTLQTLGPKYDYSESSPLPRSTSCATFVAIIFNDALNEMRRRGSRLHIERLPYAQVSPMRLCTIFQLKELYENSLYQITPNDISYFCPQQGYCA